MKILSRSFYDRKTKVVAKGLLGKFIVRQLGNKKLVEMITETEAYIGPHDLASHSRFGKTKRNETMFGPPGFAYIYLIYGIYHCFNAVTEKKNYGAAVLIRATENFQGPGLLCKNLHLDRTLNGIDLTKPGPLYISDGPRPKKITAKARIGVDYAEDWKDRKLRFVLSS